MTAEPRTLRTEAEKAIADAYAALAASLPGGKEVRQRRDAAMELFGRTGLPHRRIEEWKYTDLRALMRKAPPPAARPSDETAKSAAALDLLSGVDRIRLVIVDGFFFPALSDVAALAAAKVTLVSASEVLAGDDSAAVGVLDAGTLTGGDIAVALNIAFATDGVVLSIPEGAAIDRPIEIAHVFTGQAKSIAVRNAVRVGSGAMVKLIETFTGPSGEAYVTNAVTLVDVAARATVAVTRLQAEGDAAFHLGSTVLNASEASEVKHLAIAAGASVARGQVFLTTGGEHTRVSLNGATMLGGKQHLDATLVIDHALAGANTRILHKAVVDGRAEGVFQGKIIVEPDAQKTDAKLMCQSLLLSDEAQFAAKPELEIFADDVQCGHGATAGQIDETHLFYLMARGVPRAEAERLLIAAFLDDAIDAMGDETLGDALKRRVDAWLEKRG